jgi:predicted PurR-regulated permease PerM
MIFLPTSSRESWLRFLVSVLFIAAAIYVLWRVRQVVTILLLGVLLAYFLRPAVDFFQRMRLGPWRASRGFAVALTFILLILLILALVRALLPPLGHELYELRINLPEHQQRLESLWTSAREFYHNNLPDTVRATLDGSFGEAVKFAKDRAIGVVSATFHSLGFFFELFLVPILALYFLADAPGLRRQLLFFFPKHMQTDVSRTFDGFDDIMYRYVIGQIILCLLAFAVVTIALKILGIKFWLLLGLLAGITRAVPVIGPLLGGIPIIGAVLAQSQDLYFGVWVTVGFVLLHLFESKYLMPAILGRQLDIHPVLIIVALLVGAEFFGLIGMFVAVPALAAMRFLIAEHRAHTSVENLPAPEPEITV